MVILVDLETTSSNPAEPCADQGDQEELEEVQRHLQSQGQTEAQQGQQGG